MRTMNCLSTNGGVYLTAAKTRLAAADSIRCLGQGEKIRFDLHVYATQQDIENHSPAIHRGLRFKDPWAKDKQTLTEILARIYHFNKKVRFQIFGTLYLDD